MIHHDLHGRSDSAEYTLQRCFADSDASGVGLETLTDWFISRLASKDYTGYLPWGCNTSSSPQVFGHTQNITKLRCKLWSHSSLGSKICGVRSYLHCRQWVWLVCNSRAPCPQPGTVLNAWVSVWFNSCIGSKFYENMKRSFHECVFFKWKYTMPIMIPGKAHSTSLSPASLKIIMTISAWDHFPRDRGMLFI